MFEGRGAAGSVEPKAHIWKVGAVVMKSEKVGRIEWGLPWVSRAGGSLVEFSP